MMMLETVAALAAALEAEIATFDAFVEGQKAFTAAIQSRDWLALERSSNLLESLSAHLAAIEGERAAAEASLRGELGLSGRDEGFYRLVQLVPEPERGSLADLFRRLKIGAMRAKFENQAGGEYASANRELLGSVLEELFPEKKGRIYGRSGRAVQPDRGAILLDAAL